MHLNLSSLPLKAGGSLQVSPENVAAWVTLVVRAKEVSGGKSSDVLDTLARVCFLKGDKEKAVALQKQAVERAKGDSKRAFEKSLESRPAGKLPPPD